MSRVIFTLRFSVLYLLIFLNVKYGSSTLCLDFNGPSKDFSRHKIVQPIIHHARTKREIPTTRYTEGLHHPEVTITVPIDGEEYILDLELNQHLVPEGHVISYKRGGETVLHKPKKEELDICQYSGSIRNKPGSWAAVSTCHGVQGAIYDGQHMRYIQPAQVEENLIRMDHYIYDHSDLNTSNLMDGSHHALNRSNDSLVLEKPLHHEDMYRVANMVKGAEIHGPFGSNSSSRYIELVLVADHGIYQEYNSDITKVHTYMKNLVNIVNSYYAPVNIFLALKAVVVWSGGDEIMAEEGNSSSILKAFLEYRHSHLNNPILKNDNAFLITCKRFEERVRGRAPRGTMCSNESGGVASYFTEVGAIEAAVVAHEIGHNLGLKHDDLNGQRCYCPDFKCIMYPEHSDLFVPVHWSQCSLEELTNAADRITTQCLRNKPTSLFESPTCGNGFLEPGEQCDCGFQADKKTRNSCHSCCDYKTCKLKPQAECANGECCDINSCRPKPSGSVCRRALNECDLPEYCTGHSEFCPRDVFKMNSTPCESKEAFCVGGSCQSHTDRCKMIWGPTARKADDNCYLLTKCEHSDATLCSNDDHFCGKLYCQNVGQLLQEGYGFGTVMNINDTNKMCFTATDSRNNTGHSVVPDGAQCGLNKMCLNQRCVPVDSLRPYNQPGQPHYYSLTNNPQRKPTNNPGNQPPTNNPSNVLPERRPSNNPTNNPSGVPPERPPSNNNPDNWPPTRPPHANPSIQPPESPPYNHPDNLPPNRPSSDHPTNQSQECPSSTDRSSDTCNLKENSDYMVALYIILGIVPLILIILVVLYYKRNQLRNNSSSFNYIPSISFLKRDGHK